MKQTSVLEFEAASGSLEAASNSKESHSIISISEKKKDKKEKHKLKLVKKSKQADKDTEVENKGKWWHTYDISQRNNNMYSITWTPTSKSEIFQNTWKTKQNSQLLAIHDTVMKSWPLFTIFCNILKWVFKLFEASFLNWVSFTWVILKKTNLFVLGEELCIFGVPLEVAVERQRCHDGVPLPMVRLHEFILLILSRIWTSYKVLS